MRAVQLWEVDWEADQMVYLESQAMISYYLQKWLRWGGGGVGGEGT